MPSFGSNVPVVRSLFGFQICGLLTRDPASEHLYVASIRENWDGPRMHSIVGREASSVACQ